MPLEIENIKKAELHCHIDGLLNPQICAGLPPEDELRELIIKLATVCPVEDRTDWEEKYLPAVGPYIHNRGEFLLGVLGQYLTSLIRQQVVYSEIMLSGFTFQYEDVERQIALYRRFRELADAIGGTALRVEFLIAFGKTSDRAKMEKLAERILAVARTGLIRGVAAAGREEPQAVKPHEDIFRRFKQAGLGIEIHAGEWGGPDLVWEALEYGHADRIGHGLAMAEDPELVRHLKKKNIHVEFCPTCNLRLTEYRSLDRHPLHLALAAGLNFSINTDDPGPIGTDLSREYSLVRECFHLTDVDMSRILGHTLSAGFGSRAVRERRSAGWQFQ
jgi:adenosine deaminase